MSGILAFPGGRKPGINPKHPAMAGGQLLYSAVATSNGANFVDLRTGTPGTPGGSPTTGINGTIGPTATFTGNPDSVVIANTAQLTTATGHTCAIIFVQNSLPGGNVFLWTQDSSGEFSLFFWNDIVHMWGNGDIQSALAPATGIPYFLIMSAGTSSYNAVLKRLDTGQIITDTGSSGWSSSTFGSTWSIGFDNNNSNRQSHASMAASAAFANYRPMSTLLAWAADPWGFWYPSPAPLTVKTAAAASTVVFRKSLSPIGGRVGSRQAWGMKAWGVKKNGETRPAIHLVRPAVLLPDPVGRSYQRADGRDADGQNIKERRERRIPVRGGERDRLDQSAGLVSGRG
jgi:hypothetical protein